MSTSREIGIAQPPHPGGQDQPLSFLALDASGLVNGVDRCRAPGCKRQHPVYLETLAISLAHVEPRNVMTGKANLTWKPPTKVQQEVAHIFGVRGGGTNGEVRS